MKLESGPAAADRNYWILVTVLCLGMAGWFIKDGSYGYLKKNREKARQQLSAIYGAEDVPTELGDTPTGAMFEALQAAKPSSAAQVHEQLGPPKHTQTTVGGETVEYFISDYGMATVRIINGRVDHASMLWTPWDKSKSEITAQFYWALIPLLFGLYAVIKLYKAATLRATIDESGMRYGARRIAFDAMIALRDYSPKGWVDLYYRHGSDERRLRIDNQKIRKFNEIVETLCQVKGFENPIKAAEAGAGNDEPGPGGGDSEASSTAD